MNEKTQRDESWRVPEMHYSPMTIESEKVCVCGGGGQKSQKTNVFSSSEEGVNFSYDVEVQMPVTIKPTQLFNGRHALECIDQSIVKAFCLVRNQEASLAECFTP